MMRYIGKAFVLVALLNVSTLSLAADSSSGCGLGWMLLPKNSLVSSFFRTMTNATFLNTIAMTLGTSGCAKHSIVENSKRSLHFAEANLDHLKADLAVGSGERAEAFARTFGCGVTTVGDFLETFRSEYNYLLPHAQVDAAQLVERAHIVIQTTPALASYCAAHEQA